MAGAALIGALGGGMTSCSPYNPPTAPTKGTHVLTMDERRESCWNTHNDRGDWELQQLI